MPDSSAESGPEAFWTWWRDGGATAVEAGIAGRTLEQLADEITGRVDQVAPGLAWELGPGRAATHQLVVTAAGDPSAGAAARRWLRAAPAATATWEYADAKPAEADVEAMSLTVGDDEVGFAAVRVAAARVGNHVDVRVHHPAFATLPEQVRNTVAFIALDSALGETDCETWVGQVEAVVDEPAGATTLSALRLAVEAVRSDATDEDGNPVWVLMEGEHEGHRLMAAAQVPLAPSWAPHLDLHLAVDVPFTGATDQGLPEPATLDALRALEDHLVERLGSSARLVAHETGAGLRRLHFYADSTTPAVAVAEAAVVGWRQGPVQVLPAGDPGWHGVRHLRT